MKKQDGDFVVKGLACFGLLVVTALLAAFGALLLWFAWNLVVPPLFGGPEITILQAYGISVLLAIIGQVFKGGKS